MPITIVNHPLVQHKLGLLREADKGKNLEITQLAGKDHTDSFLMVDTAVQCDVDTESADSRSKCNT